MRPLTFAVSAVLLLVLAACAPTTGNHSYAEDLRRLTADCEARGGILTPVGPLTGRPEADNVCRISGGGSRLPPGD